MPPLLFSSSRRRGRIDLRERLDYCPFLYIYTSRAFSLIIARYTIPTILYSPMCNEIMHFFDVEEPEKYVHAEIK